MNYNKCKIWDSQEKCWFTPIYKKDQEKEIFISQSGETYLSEWDSDNHQRKLTHDTALRFKICNFSGHRDNQQRKWYINDVIKTPGGGIGVLVWHRDRLCIGSGEANNYHAIDEISVEELKESENIGNICETPDYYKLIALK